MTDEERVEELIALRAKLRSDSFRASMEERRNILAEIVALVNYDSVLLTNAMSAADILSQPNYSSHMYENMEGRIDLIVGQAIAVLSKGIKRKGKAGSKVFIGHGGSPVWKEVRDFIQDRLKLEWDEFDRVPVAGITNIVRLSQMLDEAAVAFLVLTAEDEQKDERMHARMNVIHEAGLFQGRLGFEKAILLLEDGCEEFSNIHGLGQIRFKMGNVSAIFEDIRRVLEREGLITIE